MRGFLRFSATLVTLALLVPPAASAQDVSLSGQVRPRSEYRDPSGVGNGTEAWTSLRTRLAVTYTTPGGVSAFVQFQDVRFFGEESSTLADYRADNLDLHQGWVQVGNEQSLAAVRVGRQEVALGGERLVGAVGWAQQGRSFDGARTTVRVSDRLKVDLLGFQVSESAAPSQTDDETFWGAYATYGIWTGRTLDVFALRQYRDAAGGKTRQWTSGLRYAVNDGAIRYRVEGAWQTGERRGADASAFLVGARGGTELAGGKAGVDLWLDYVSGTEPGSDEVGVFDTLFGTNHKFYGYADLFTDLPVHTAGRGLVDAAVKGWWQLHPDWTANLDVHRFRVAEDDGLDASDLGTEIDLTLTRALFSGLRVSGGAAYVVAGDALGPVRGISDDVTFAYLMLDVVF